MSRFGGMHAMSYATTKEFLPVCLPRGATCTSGGELRSLYSPRARSVWGVPRKREASRSVGAVI